MVGDIAPEDAIWPEETNASDRILAQMRYNPLKSNANSTWILIYLPHGYNIWGVDGGRKEFELQNCPVSNCLLTDSKQDATKADAIVFRHHFVSGLERNSSDQIWIYYALESPENTPSLVMFKDMVNWTATYRSDSDIVTPYEKYSPYPEHEIRSETARREKRKRKRKHVAWFVSNCLTSNRRHEYANQLSKHIPVDIFGSCGPKRCSRQDAKCGRMLDEEYRFYLAFENSNCRDYITEKFFIEGLQ
jgi:glycoprotein 3-alpha-L-fucosyltransferase